MKPTSTHFQVLKKAVPGSIEDSISTSVKKKWIMAVITTIFLMVGLGMQVSAQTTRFWITAGATTDFNDGTNWSLTSGGAAIGGTITWAAADIATFNASSASPTVNLNGNYAITTVSVAAGTLTLSGSGTLSLSGTGTGSGYFLATGTSLTIGSGVTISVSGSSPFTANRGTTYGPGTILLNGTNINFPNNGAGTGTFNAATPPNIVIANGKAATVNSTTVNVASLSIGTSATAKLTIGSGNTIIVKGTFSNYGTTSNGLVSGGTGATIIFNGTGQSFPKGGASAGGAFGTGTSTYPGVTIANGTSVTVDATVNVNALNIGTSANAATALNLNSNAITVNGAFSNFGTVLGLAGPGTITFVTDNTTFPGSGVFSGVTAPNVILVGGDRSNNAKEFINNADVTLNNLSIGSSTSLNYALLTINTGITLTVTGTFSNYYSSNSNGLKGPGTIKFNGNGSQKFPIGGGSGNSLFITSTPPIVTIATGVTVTVDRVVTVRGLNLNTGSTLIGGGQIITVTGAVDNNGAHTSTSGGSINLTGTTQNALSGSGSYGNLTLNNATGAKLSSNSNPTINGAFTLTSGIFDAATNGDTVFVSSTGSVARTNGWVYGFLGKYFSASALSQTFQVGDNATNYRPVTVSFPSITTPGYLMVNNTTGTYGLTPPLINQNVNAYWSLINHNIAPQSATVTFNYLAGDILVGTQSTFISETYVTNTEAPNYGTWINPWTGSAPTSTSTQVTGVTSFGDFVVGPIPPPVQITGGGPLTFCQGGSVVLNSAVFPAGTYTYNWYEVGAPATSLGSGTTYTATASGQYYLQTTDVSSNVYTSNTLTVTVNLLPTVNVGSALPNACPGGNTVALGGSFGGGATGAVWSTIATGGSFANNTGSTPGTATYTTAPSSTAGSSVTLTLTTTGGSCGTANASKTVTIHPRPIALGINSSLPAVICDGSPLVLTDQTTGSYTRQWVRDGVDIPGATSNPVSASVSGLYTVKITNTVTGCTSDDNRTGIIDIANSMAEAVTGTNTLFLTELSVGSFISDAWGNYLGTVASITSNTKLTMVEDAGRPYNGAYKATPKSASVTDLPRITQDTILIACNDSNAVITTTTPTIQSYNGTVTADMSAATIVTGVGSGGGTKLICNGGSINLTGGPASSTYFVEPGGSLTNAFNGYGNNVAYIKSGGTFTAGGGGGNNFVYYEPGAIVNRGASPYTFIQVNTIGIIYPSGVDLSCIPYSYTWSNATTASSASVKVSALSGNAATAATFGVTVKQGNTTCTDQVVVVNTTPIPTFTAQPGTGGCQGANATYTTQSGQNNYIWTFTGILNTDYSIVSGGTTSSNTVSVQWLTNGSKTVTVNYTNRYGCTGVSPATSNSTSVSYCWIGGNNSNDWSTSTNWSGNTVPNSCAADVIIPAGANGPVVNAPIAVGNLTITGSGSEAITLNSALSLCGNWTNSVGVTSSVTGNPVVLMGSSAQTLSGRLSFDQLAINNTDGGVSLAAGTTVNIYAALILQAGNFDATNGAVTLRSTSVNSAAYINDFSGYTGTYTGNITAQRYYAASSTFQQHLIGSPINNTPFAALGAAGGSGYTVPTSDCDETVNAYHSPSGNLYKLDETKGAGCALKEWYVLSSGGTTTNGVGYSQRIFGSGTLSITGLPNLDASYTVGGVTNTGWLSNSTKQGRVMHPGWQLLSNPYPAYLDVASILADNSAVLDDQILVWNSNGAGAGSYTAATIIPPFQAFMVHVTNVGTVSVAINGSARTTTTASTFFKDANTTELKITATNSSTNLVDETRVGFNENATAGFDPRLDMDKLPGALTRHTLYTGTMDRWMAVNTLRTIEETSSVPVGMEPGVSGAYVFAFDGINSFDPTSYITLEDKKLNIFHDVRNGAYTFNANATDNWDRFILHFTPSAIILTQDVSCESSGMINIQQPGTASWSYTIADNGNTTVSSGVLNAGNAVAVSVTAGVYNITLVDNNGYTVVKNIEVQGQQALSAAFNISANTVEVNQPVALNCTTPNTAFYNWDFGDGFNGNGTAVTHSYSNPGIYNVTLAVTNSSGCISSTSHSVIVNPRSVTGVNDLNDVRNIRIWSNDNIISIDFSQIKDVQTDIEIYNILGQKLFADKYATSNIYRKKVSFIEEGYIVVSLKNNGSIITKKLFINNVK